jgi:hypothetical protein
MYSGKIAVPPGGGGIRKKYIYILLMRVMVEKKRQTHQPKIIKCNYTTAYFVLFLLLFSLIFCFQ